MIIVIIMIILMIVLSPVCNPSPPAQAARRGSHIISYYSVSYMYMCITYIYIYIHTCQGGFPAKRISSEQIVYACSLLFVNPVFYDIK